MRALFVAMLAMLPAKALAQDVAPEEKPKIRSQADLPRYTYDVDVSASALFTSDQAFLDLATRVRADIEKLLATYDIEDKATLRDFHRTLKDIALLAGNYGSALEHAAEARSLEGKPAARHMTGLLTSSIVAAERSVQAKEAATRQDAFREHFASAVAKLPWDVVQDNVEQMKGDAEILSRNILIGLLQSRYDPAVTETGKLSGEAAREIIGMRVYADVVFLYKDAIVDVLQAYIEEYRTEKPNIWPDRAVDLTGREDLTPVVIGISDTGVDALVYGERMYRNEAEVLDGRDNDGNGFVDDVHGIAHGLWGKERMRELLYPLSPEDRARLPELKDRLKGTLDIQANIDSPEARALKQEMAQMKPAEVKPFMERLSLFANYVHGTHVAGIVVEGNPAAQILVLRLTPPLGMIPPPLMKEDAESLVRSTQETMDYLKQHNARVVNMSWGLGQKAIERMYEVNGIGADAEERASMAQEAYTILKDGLTRAFESVPEILFVPAAGNADADVGFDEGIPASIVLPNVLTAGAVDQAGEETSFTSFGEKVKVHTNGFEVESYLPGGERIALSGTSMSAPNATNLAAKLIALDPSLTPPEVVELIVAGGDRSEDGRRMLINPKRSVELLMERMQIEKKR